MESRVESTESLQGYGGNKEDNAHILSGIIPTGGMLQDRDPETYYDFEADC